MKQSQNKVPEKSQNIICWWFVSHEMKKLSCPISVYLILLNLWNNTLCHEGVLFKRILATTDFLAHVSSFNATSRIECGSQCLLKMDHDPCTAFSLDVNSATCTCGKKRFAPVQVTGSVSKLHVVDSCPKIKTGQLCPAKFYTPSSSCSCAEFFFKNIELMILSLQLAMKSHVI